MRYIYTYIYIYIYTYLTYSDIRYNIRSTIYNILT